jgi:hypothetical protein
MPFIIPKLRPPSVSDFVLSSNLEEVLDLVQAFPEGRTPLSHTREDIHRVRVFGADEASPNSVILEGGFL